ncbi:MAG: copper homeostasis protein CutC [Ferruginibacter sp.]
MNFKLEVIGFNIESCIAAQLAGADRIELCDNPGDGGTTPSYGFIKAATQELHIDLFPIIRPRGGDFLYSDDEFEIMKTDVEVCKQLGCEGIVIGMLKSDGTVDKERCSILAELVYPLSITFHRAFDRTVDPVKAMEDIIEIGCERILTSGQKQNALDGADLIKKLIEQSNNRIIIMPGSGVRSDNIAELAKRTGAREFHTSARIFADSKMKYINQQMNEALRSVSVDENEIKKIIKALHSVI